MSALKATHAAQTPLVAEFNWNFDDTMVATDGVSYSLGADTASDIIANAKIFEVLKLPVNSVILSGYVVVTTTFDTAGYDVIIGDSGSANRYLASTDVKTAGATVPLVPTGYVNTGGLPLRVSMATDDACTAGAARLVVTYIISNRAAEVTAHP